MQEYEALGPIAERLGLVMGVEEFDGTGARRFRPTPASGGRQRVGVLLVVVVFSAVAGVAGPAMSPASAVAAVGEDCPPGWLPVRPIPDPGEDGFDSNVSVFVGGTFAVRERASEAEGLVVSLGSVDIERSSPGVYNVGSVGAGSGVVPVPGSAMLVARGDLRGHPVTTINVGHGVGGSVVVGGVTAPGTVVETNGGDHADGVANAGARFVNFPELLQSKSTQWAALPVTGAVDVSPTAVTFVGDGLSDPQVLRIDGSQVSALSSTRSLQFLGIRQIPPSM